MSNDVYTVAAANLVKDNRKAKPPKGSNEDTGYFFKPGETITAKQCAERGMDPAALIASGAFEKPKEAAGADKKGAA